MAKKAAPKSSQKHPDEEIDEIEDGNDEDFGEAPPPEEVPDKGAENKEGDGEPVPPAGSHTITIEGERHHAAHRDGWQDEDASRAARRSRSTTMNLPSSRRPTFRSKNREKEMKTKLPIDMMSATALANHVAANMGLDVKPQMGIGRDQGKNGAGRIPDRLHRAR